MSKIDHPWNQLIDLLVEIDQSDKSEPVRKPVDPDRVVEELDLSLPDQGIGFDEFVKKLKRLALATPASGSKAFFNQLFGGRDPTAVIGDAVASALNISMYTWKVAGPQAAVENLLIKALCKIIGYPAGEGSFTPGGSLSNLIAMLIARNQFSPRAHTEGITEVPCCIYTSTEGHYSIRKNAGILGIGQNNVRDIPVDEKGRMLPDALTAAIDQDIKRGLRPLLINATAGTTVRGAFDPFAELAAIARKYDIWLHVDGAFGGPLILCGEMQELFRGVEESDSFTWDAHKLMGVPLTCSILLVKKRGALLSSLHEQADYLFQADEKQLEPGMTSIQCGRRNDALKLWSSWQVHGHVGYAKRFSKLLALIRHAADVIRNASDMSLSAEPQSVTVCFEINGCSSERICALLETEQRALIGYGSVCGRKAIRLICANPELEVADIDHLFKQIRTVAARLKSS